MELQKVERRSGVPKRSCRSDEVVCRHFPRYPIHGAFVDEGPHDVHGSMLLLLLSVTPSSSLSSSIHSSFSEAAGGSTHVFDTALQTCVQLSPQSPMCQVWAPLPQLDTVCDGGHIFRYAVAHAAPALHPGARAQHAGQDPSESAVNNGQARLTCIAACSFALVNALDRAYSPVRGPQVLEQ